MSKLEKLIGTLCCGGVEYQELGLLGRFYGGLTGKTKSDFVNGNAKLITYKNVYSNPALDINPVDTVNIYDSENQRTLEYGDVIFTGSSETPDECGFSSVVTKNPTCDLYLNSFCFFFRFNDPDIILPDFSKHLFRSERLRYQIGKTANGVTRFNVSKDKMAKIKIPLPPLPVQQEIVRILDSFTDLTAELTAELTARKKQYAYYRDELLTFGDQVPMVRLGDIAEDLYRGAGIKREETTSEGIPCVRYGEIYTTYNIWFDKCVTHTKEEKISNKKYFEYGDILFAITGESVEEIAKSCVYVGQEKCLAGGDIVVMKHKQNPKYMGYVLSTTNAQMQKSKGKVKSKVVHSSVPAISDIVVPIPTLEEQARIVSILDRFDALCNNLTSGLPAEIAARQKQYEYYRDKLLSFKELEVK